jgi:endonuclease YncB( thermonuclease family)
MKTQKYEGKVVKVTDGDTIKVEVYGEFFETKLSQTLNIRMVGIDAPEIHGVEAPMGVKTKAWLKDRIEGKTVTVELQGKDYYKRWLGTLFDGETNINELLVKEHLAEIYSPEKHNDGVLDIEEEE